MSAIGGLMKMISHFKSHGTFISFTINPKINKELISFCEYLIKEKSKALDDFSKYNTDKINNDPLSVRAENIILELGGTQNLLLHYKKFGSFLNIPKSGSKTDLELKVYCNDLINQDPNINFHFDNSEQVNYLELSERAKNIVVKLGGAENILNHYILHGHFLNIHNSGKRTDLELKAFCEKLLKQDINVIHKRENIVTELTNVDLDNCLLIYELLKLNLSTRTLNAVRVLEKKDYYQRDHQFKILFIKKYFINSFNYSEIKNLGSKSIAELKMIKINIINYKNNPISTKEVQAAIITLRLNSEYKTTFTNKTLLELFNVHGYSFQTLFSLVLFENKSLGALGQAFVKIKYFSPKTNNNEIAKILNCSKERLRQLENKIIQKYIPNIIHYTLNIIQNEPIDLPKLELQNIIILNNFISFNLDSITYTPNTLLSRTVYSIYYADKYTPIDKFIYSTFKTFEVPCEIIMLSLEFIQKSDFKNLLNWLDTQIYYFETIAYEYMLESLITRFYFENEKVLHNSILGDLMKVLNIIKKKSIEINLVKYKKSIKKEANELLTNTIYEYLNRINKSQTTKEILSFLHSKDITIDKTLLLKLLHSKRGTFAYSGMGNWRIRESVESEDYLRGTFRDIIKNLLLKRTEPIHISEIYEHINTFKKVSITSIISNLRAETEGTFRHFNCSYIGLSDKKYDDYWYKIPTFKAYHLNKRFYPNSHVNDLEIIKHLSKIFGYPEQHLAFILSARKGNKK